MYSRQWEISAVTVDGLSSDVKRGQNLEAEARATRQRPAEAETNFWRLWPRPRPKIIVKKVPNND